MRLLARPSTASNPAAAASPLLASPTLSVSNAASAALAARSRDVADSPQHLHAEGAAHGGVSAAAAAAAPPPIVVSADVVAHRQLLLQASSSSTVAAHASSMSAGTPEQGAHADRGAATVRHASGNVAPDQSGVARPLSASDRRVSRSSVRVPVPAPPAAFADAASLPAPPSSPGGGSGGGAAAGPASPPASHAAPRQGRLAPALPSSPPRAAAAPQAAAQQHLPPDAMRTPGGAATAVINGHTPSAVRDHGGEAALSAPPPPAYSSSPPWIAAADQHAAQPPRGGAAPYHVMPYSPPPRGVAAPYPAMPYGHAHQGYGQQAYDTTAYGYGYGPSAAYGQQAYGYGPSAGYGQYAYGMVAAPAMHMPTGPAMVLAPPTPHYAPQAPFYGPPRGVAAPPPPAYAAPSAHAGPRDMPAWHGVPAGLPAVRGPQEWHGMPGMWPGLVELVASAGPIPQRAVVGNMARQQRNLLEAVSQWRKTASCAHLTDAMHNNQRLTRLVPQPPGSAGGMFRATAMTGQRSLLPAAPLATDDASLRRQTSVYLGGTAVIPSFTEARHGNTGYYHVFSAFFNDRMLRPVVFVVSHVTALRGLTQSLIDHAETLRHSDVMDIPDKRRKYYFASSIVVAAAQTLCLANYPGATHTGLRNRSFNPNDKNQTDFVRRLAGGVGMAQLHPACLIAMAQPLANQLAKIIPLNRAKRRTRRAREDVVARRFAAEGRVRQGGAHAGGGGGGRGAAGRGRAGGGN